MTQQLTKKVGVNSLKDAGVRREKNIQGLYSSGDEQDAYWYLLEQVQFAKLRRGAEP